ncbi:MAG: exo-alpha-sialidase [bacterium]|nr:exo-alpha-sialidase [bacterium]
MLVKTAHSAAAIALALAVLLCGGCTQSKSAVVHEVSGPYLGQDPPGLTPEVFAPDIISTDGDEGCTAFLDNGRVFVFNRSTQDNDDWSFIPIYVMQLGDNGWSAAAPATFQESRDDDNFTAAPDGKSLYFQSHRPSDGSVGPTEHVTIWSVTWDGSGWSEPQVMITLEGESLIGGYPSITSDGTLYIMSSMREGYGKVDIFRSRLIDGRYGPAENLGPRVNSQHIDLDSFVAPDESYLLFCSDRPGGHNAGYDLYVAFRLGDGSWGEAINMGVEINTGLSVTRPSVTPDGRFVFFCKHPEGGDTVHWIDAKIIEQLRAPQSESASEE